MRVRISTNFRTMARVDFQRRRRLLLFGEFFRQRREAAVFHQDATSVGDGRPKSKIEE